MVMFIVGLALFTAGAITSAVGSSIHKRLVQDSDTGIVKWFVQELPKWFNRLTDLNATVGQRIAAYGTIISAIGLVLTITGIGVWAAS
jgi:hypothetical protein